MITREDVYSIEARINPRVQMFYITYPYTSHLDDARLLSADSAEASQITRVREAHLLASVKQSSPLTIDFSVPERGTGHIVTKQA